MLGVLIFDTLPGLFIGIFVSALLLLYRASRPNVAVLGHVPGTAGQWGDLARHPENARRPGIVVLRPESGLFFANADEVRERIRGRPAADGTRAIVLDAETMPFIDVTAATMLTELERDLERDGSQARARPRHRPGPRHPSRRRRRSRGPAGLSDGAGGRRCPRRAACHFPLR